MDDLEGDLLGRVYGAIQAPEDLIGVYADVAKSCGGFAAHYLSMDPQQRIVIDTRISDPDLLAAQDDYADYYVGIDDRLPWLGSGTPGRWRADQQVFDEGHVRHSAIYNDFLRPIGIKRMAACILNDEPSRSKALCVARRHDAGDFSGEDLQRLAFFSTHLVRATQLREQLTRAQSHLSSAERALNHLPYVALWLDARRVVRWMSDAGKWVFAADDGFRMRGERLHCTDAQLDARLGTLLQTACQAVAAEGGWFRVPRKASSPPWLLSLIPGELPQELGAASGRYALLVIQDGAGPPLPHALQLRQLFGLTPAEARLAIGLLQNESPASYAERHQLQLSTVRSQLRSLLAKTGTRRQVELLRMVGMPVGSMNRVGAAR